MGPFAFVLHRGCAGGGEGSGRKGRRGKQRANGMIRDPPAREAKPKSESKARDPNELVARQGCGMRRDNERSRSVGDRFFAAGLLKGN